MTVERALLGTTDANTAANYIEDVFSTYLYTGTGANQTITNGIDLSTKSGMVWLKGRSGATPHALFDTARGAGNILASNTTAAQLTNSNWPNTLTSFSSNGFSLGNDIYSYGTNISGATYASWTFRKQAKFFDVVTYTGNGSNRTIAHNLGSVPGCIMVKRTNSTGDWQVYHRSLANTEYLVLNTTDAKATGATRWNSTTPTSSVFSLGTDATVNASGGTYVAYLFAHDAGGFGSSGTDSVISCGSFTVATGGTATLNLGWEPQYVLAKRTNGLSQWPIVDVMRGMPNGGQSVQLIANDTNAEGYSSDFALNPVATGVSVTGGNVGYSYVYIAIRRGPMRTPTLGTSVFSPIASSAGTGTKLTTNFPVDLQIYALRTGTTGKGQTVDRLRGVSANATESGALLATNSSAIEVTNNIPTLFWDNTGFQMPSSFASSSDVFWSFRRSPGFFDAVCYKGTGANTTVTHNLAVAPELILVKSRSSAVNWSVYAASQGASKFMYLNTTLASTTGATFWNSTDPTASVFSVGTSTGTNGGSANYIAYLFATCPGVSKVGSYTGTGTTKQIDCGFTGGARFVMIKRADSAGDWYVWDTARGISASNDPYLLMNSSAAEVTNTDYVDPYAAGFEISSTAPAAINANGGTFIYLAIA